MSEKILVPVHFFLEKGGWTPACPLPSEVTRASHSPDEIDEYAFVVVLQVRQVVGEVGEVVADASLQVLANVMIDRGQRAATSLTYIREVKRSHLRQALPLPEEPPVHAQHRELSGVVEEIRVHAIQAFLSQAVGVLATEGPIRREVVGQIERRDVALLKELGRGVLQSHLTCGRDVIEVRVLGQGVQPVVPHRTVSVADHGLGVATGIELAARAITDRVVQLADYAPVGRQLQLEIVTKQPHGRVGMRLVELFRVIPAILDRARELHLMQAVAHADPGRLAIGLGAGVRVAQLAELRAAAEIPALFRREVDSSGVSKAAQGPPILVTLLDVDTGGVGEPRLRARNQVALAAAKQLAVVRPLVFQRIVQVKTGALGIEKASADLSAESEVSVGGFPVDPEAFRQAIGAAYADAIIVFTAAACRDRVLAETIGAPGGAGIELHLRDRVRALALNLGQGNNRRMVLAQVVAHAGADGPFLGQLVAHVQFERPGLEPLILNFLIALGREAQAARHWHPECAAVLLGVLYRRLSRRRVTSVEAMLIDREATVAALEEIAQPDAQVGAVGARFRAGERLVVRAMKPESAIVGSQRGGEETLAAARLHLEPGIGTLPQG